MTTEDRLHSRVVEEQLERDDRARRIQARVKASKTFMAGMKASMEARLRGERGTPFEDLKRKDA